MSLNVVVVGVGGQGLITLSNLVAKILVDKGINVVVAETHGLSQRGGSVIVHLRIGDDVEAPLVPVSGANLVLAMELIEAVRYSPYLSENAIVVANDYILPPPLPEVNVPNRETLIEVLKRRARLEVIPATKIALELGDARVANMVLLGYSVARGFFKPYLSLRDVEEAIKRHLGRNVELNVKAVREGAKLASLNSS